LKLLCHVFWFWNLANSLWSIMSIQYDKIICN
jgi:hypothetical protein